MKLSTHRLCRLSTRKGFTPLEISKTPHKKAKSLTGFTLVEIMIVVAIIGLLAVIAIPNLVRARETAQHTACYNNMRQIDAAKHRWSLEGGKTGADTPLEDELAIYIRYGFPTCPAQGTYVIDNADTPPSCTVHEAF